ncbi:MAG: heavy-metal-associated domain-containing protein [Thermaurantimonas sp.]
MIHTFACLIFATMEVKFKTTLKCQGCVDKVADDLTREFGSENWSVDLTTNPKILVVNSDSADKAIEILENRGYKAEKVAE